jgi:uncharacterized protein (DUF1697 family)
MATWVLFLRGINVGGHCSLPMKELVSLLESQGCQNVRTYIQSGNAVFEATKADAARIAKQLGPAIRKKRGFEPRLHVLSLAELEAAAAGNPYPQAVAAEPRLVHVFFLTGTPSAADIEAMNAVKAPHEAFTLKGKHFYVHTPKGFGTSKLAASALKRLGEDCTARNWRTITAVLDLART